LTISGGRIPDADDADEAETFEALFTREYEGLLKVAYLMTGSRQVAEDLTHDAFVKVQSRLTFVERPGAYLRVTVVNLARSHLRRRKVEERFRLLARPEAHAPTGDEMFDALATLSPSQRTAVVLRFYEDLSDEDIAARLGVRPATVRSLIHRGLARLSKVVER
jgi:RNA polymerase sigma factor (sigma-70 family)